MKRYIQVLILLIGGYAFAVSLMSDFLNSASLGYFLKISSKKPDVDKGWLPDLSGLPNKEEVRNMTIKLLKLLNEENDPKCNSININLRVMIFQHFLIYQQLLNSQNVYLNDNVARQWAHMLAMILKESSGDTTNITDFSGRTLSTNDTKANLKQWRKILELTKNSYVKLNYQTNFGLTQTSADRLFVAFSLARNERQDYIFLERRPNDPRTDLNSAIAIRRLIWFYQDFAQGRTSEFENRIPRGEIYRPEYYKRFMNGVNAALLYCGTRFMFRAPCLKECKRTERMLEDAMASIAYCKLGNYQTGYGQTEFDEMCFAQWVTLCPALNIDIALLTPLSYFATRNALPVCEHTFKRLVIKKHSWFSKILGFFSK